jgi:hypothetical protein
MRIKRQGNNLAAVRPRVGLARIHQSLVAQVHAVKVADGDRVCGHVQG